jgi:hypothetical protein
MDDETQQNEVATYAAAVRAELADLSGTEREALLEDLEDHLAEVVAESGVSLRSRLGDPATYAAELRAAYGVDNRSTAQRFRRISLVTTSAKRRILGSRAYQAVREYVPELQPAWWVLRGYLAVLALAVLLRGDQTIRPIPNPFTSGGLVEIIAMAAAVVASVSIGRWTLREKGRAVWKMRAANLVVALPGLIALGSMSTLPDWAGTYSSAGAPDAYAAGPTTNIYPYTKDGKPLEGVLLYDQDGRPVTVSADGYGVVTQYATAADGQPITNEYPLRQTTVDGAKIVAPRVAIPPLSPSPSPSPTSSSPSSPTASP